MLAASQTRAGAKKPEVNSTQPEVNPYRCEKIAADEYPCETNCGKRELVRNEFRQTCNRAKQIRRPDPQKIRRNT